MFKYRQTDYHFLKLVRTAEHENVFNFKGPYTLALMIDFERQR